MTTAETLNERANDIFPNNKIVLLDGRMLDCYPKAEGAMPEATDEQERLFIVNAFYLLAHKERLLSDSRMFLCPVAVRNGLYYTGGMGFSFPTLGVYLEWWSLADGAMFSTGQGRKGLVCGFRGSPLSGANKCSVVYDDGATDVVSLPSFIGKWSPFTKINCRYSEAKTRYQSYTLEDVISILRNEDEGNRDYASAIATQYMVREVATLKSRLCEKQKECLEWRAMYTSTLVRVYAEQFRRFYAAYEAFRAKADAECCRLREQRRELRSMLREGNLDSRTYQLRLRPLAKRLRELRGEVSAYKYNKVCETFPNERDVSFQMIEQFVLGERQENQKPA